MPIVRSNFGARFQRFCDVHLALPEGTIEITAMERTAGVDLKAWTDQRAQDGDVNFVRRTRSMRFENRAAPAQPAAAPRFDRLHAIRLTVSGTRRGKDAADPKAKSALSFPVGVALTQEQHHRLLPHPDHLRNMGLEPRSARRALPDGLCQPGHRRGLSRCTAYRLSFCLHQRQAVGRRWREWLTPNTDERNGRVVPQEQRNCPGLAGSSPPGVDLRRHAYADHPSGAQARLAPAAAHHAAADPGQPADLRGERAPRPAVVRAGGALFPPLTPGADRAAAIYPLSARRALARGRARLRALRQE